MSELAEAVAADEYVTPLAAAVRKAESRAVALLGEAAGSSKQPGPLPPPPPPSPGRTVIDQGEKSGIASGEALQLIEKLKKTAGKEHNLRIWLRWRIEKDGK